MGLLDAIFGSNDKWLETKTTREIPESEVPEWAKKGVEEGWDTDSKNYNLYIS